MSSVEDPQVKMELESLEQRISKLERYGKESVEKDSAKNSDQDKGGYRITEKDGNPVIEFKTKKGWVKSASTAFSRSE